MTQRVTAILAVCPSLVLALGSVGLLCAATFSTGWWTAQDESLAEAVLTRNTAEIVRLVALGQDPNEPAPVRRQLRDSRVRGPAITPLDAAIRTGSPELAALLIRLGAVPSTEQLQAIAEP
jgi:hypothetical protein